MKVVEGAVDLGVHSEQHASENEERAKLVGVAEFGVGAVHEVGR